MPSAEEMEAFASVFLDTCRDQIKGLGWCCYRQAADNYLAWLHKDRFDESDADRSEVLRLPEPLNVTVGDVMTVLPFRNRVSTFELTGADVLAALENGVSRVGRDTGTGRFLQVSGLHYSWDGSEAPGERIVSAEVLNEDGSFSPIDPQAIYRVAANDFLRNDGDEFYMFRDNAINARDDGKELDVVLMEYLAANSPVMPEIEGRITRIDK